MGGVEKDKYIGLLLNGANLPIEEMCVNYFWKTHKWKTWLLFWDGGGNIVFVLIHIFLCLESLQNCEDCSSLTRLK